MMYDFFIAPLVDIFENPLFFIEVVIGGMSAGIMYALVAMGFAIIFKASGIVNFAQGAMVLFAALTFVGQLEMGVPIWLALLSTVAVMVALAWAIERVVLGPLVNQPLIVLFMATIGLSFVIEGLGEMAWGSSVHALDIGLPRGSFFVGDMMISRFDLTAAGSAAAMVLAIVVFMHKTKFGRALRAVADDHQAALSVGIPLRFIWVMVWSIAGVIALVGGIMWGTQSGVQFSLVLIAFKALPVLILGGFTSIAGAVVAGLIIGVGETVFEVYWGQLLGGATENWFAYVVAMIFLFFRPQGLFGERIIERV
ncbi:MAG: branched-chain amino acid ABC transporter permease [Hyphomicrobiales bacterium]